MNREEWLEKRKKGIGGSDAAAVIGQNPYMTNVQLWEIKTGRKEQEDISNKEAVKFGTLAEDPIRALFALDFPEYMVMHQCFKTYQNKEHYFIRGSFDGELLHKQTKETGLVEFKTGTIRRLHDWEKWGGKDFHENKIPQNYYIQILHYFLVREDFKYAILKARLKELTYSDNEEFKSPKIHIRHYKINRQDCINDLAYLYEKEKEFWHYVERDERPPLIIQGV